MVLYTKPKLEAKFEGGGRFISIRIGRRNARSEKNSNFRSDGGPVRSTKKASHAEKPKVPVMGANHKRHGRKSLIEGKA